MACQLNNLETVRLFVISHTKKLVPPAQIGNMADGKKPYDKTNISVSELVVQAWTTTRSKVGRLLRYLKACEVSPISGNRGERKVSRVSRLLS